MQAAKNAIDKKNITKPYVLMCSAKGITRKKGVEIFYISNNCIERINKNYLYQEELNLTKDNPLRLLFQKLQDAAHDFSNNARKKKMTKDRFNNQEKRSK